MLRKEFQKYENFVFDLDGTVWYWNKLIPGVKETILYLEKTGKKVFYLTNNSVFGPEGFAKKLSSLGLKTDSSKVTCASEFLLFYLKEKKIKKIFVVGEDELRKFLEENGMEITKDPEYVVLAQEENISKENEKIAVELILSGVPAVGEAKGRAWMMANEIKPGVGVLIERIEKTTGKKIEIVGKPSQISIDYVKQKYGFNPKKTILFGDELNSDIVFANRSGWDSAFVLTGRDRIEQAEKMKEEKPDFILTNLKDILE